MAFISEIRVGAGGTAGAVEVTLSPAEEARAGEFALARYGAAGGLEASETLVPGGGATDPETGHLVHLLPAGPGAGEGAAAVALIDGASSAPVLAFLGLGGEGAAIAARDGPAEGAVARPVAPGAEAAPIRFDAFGNRLDGGRAREAGAICLTAGTLIDTPGGRRPIETLRVGDLVTTRDSGDRPIRMIHSRRLEGPELRRRRALWPVRIARGALGFGLPERDLWVSPQHRMLWAHIRIGLMFGEDAVLVRAKSLAAVLEGVTVDGSVEAVTYYHLVFDAHEIIYAEGAATESFHPGAEGLAALDGETRAELYALFPALRAGIARAEADYMTLRSWELRTAVA